MESDAKTRFIADVIAVLSRWLLVSVLGFKIRFRKECRFESGPGHHFKINDLRLIARSGFHTMSASVSAPCLRQRTALSLVPTPR